MNHLKWITDDSNMISFFVHIDEEQSYRC